MELPRRHGGRNYAHKLDVLRQHCAAVGRDYDTILKTWSADAVAIAATEAEARRIAEASPYNSNAIIGTPEQVAQQLQVFVDLGVEYLIVRVLDFPATAGIELFVQDSDAAPTRRAGALRCQIDRARAPTPHPTRHPPAACPSRRAPSASARLADQRSPAGALVSPDQP